MEYFSPFLSKGTYLCLPTKKRPKVFVAINNKQVSKNAFNLYNPFSKKAKVLKCILEFFCVRCNALSRLILPTTKAVKSNFIVFLEDKLKIQLITSSVYLATDKDKVVLQIQAEDKIVGYLKYPLNQVGVKHLLNEKRGLELLSNTFYEESYSLFGTYKDIPFLFMKPLLGQIDKESERGVYEVLDAFKKSEKYVLSEHPRLKQLEQKLQMYNLSNYISILKDVGASSSKEYVLVFEHGDFAPWNLIKTKNGCIPFDLEYFEENGLEFLDEIKYYYQIEHLLNGKKGGELIKAVASNVHAKEFIKLFKIFLIKEIINKHESSLAYDFENTMLKILLDETA